MKKELELRSRVIPQEISYQFLTKKLMCKKCHFLGIEMYDDLCLKCKLEDENESCSD